METRGNNESWLIANGLHNKSSRYFRQENRKVARYWGTKNEKLLIQLGVIFYRTRVDNCEGLLDYFDSIYGS